MSCNTNTNCLKRLLTFENQRVSRYLNRLLNEGVFRIDKDQTDVIDWLKEVGKYNTKQINHIIREFNNCPKYCCPDNTCRHHIHQCGEKGVQDNVQPDRMLTAQEVLKIKKQAGLRHKDYCNTKEDCPKLSWRDEYKYVCEDNRCRRIKNPKYNPTRRVNRFMGQSLSSMSKEQSLRDKSLDELKQIGKSLGVDKEVKDKRVKQLWKNAIKSVIKSNKL